MSKYRGNAGYAMVEFLLSLLIVLMLVPSILLCLSCMDRALAFQESVQDEIAIQQLRRVLVLSYDVEVNGNSLSFRYQGKERQLNYIHDKLMIQPGTWIFLTELDECNLYQENDIIYVSYEREGKSCVSPLKKQ